MAEKKTVKKTEKKIEETPGNTEEELLMKLTELTVIIPKGVTPKEAYAQYLRNKIKKINANIHRFQYMKKNCDAQFKKRFELEKELGIKTKRLYSFTEERLTEEDGVEYRDVYVAFVPGKPKKKDWRKFLTPKDVEDYIYVK